MSSQTSPQTVEKNLELTPLSISAGIVLAIVMGAANVYLGLKVGLTVSASIPAAVVGMLVLRTFTKRAGVLEANQIQTSASAGESLAAGIIFTMPALVLIGYWQSFDWWMTTLIAFSGGLLGILFMIPMRRVFVSNPDSELKFPEGVACAAVLQTGSQPEAENANTKGPSGAISVVIGGVAGAVFKFFTESLHWFSGTLETAFRGSRTFFLGSDISPALLAVGFIVGLPVASMVFLGGAMAWLIGIPLIDSIDTLVASLGFDVPTLAEHEHAVEHAYGIWSGKIRYIGVGAMVVGGIVSITKVVEGLRNAMQTVKAAKASTSVTSESDDRDLPLNIIIILASIASLFVGVLYFMLTQNLAIALLTTIIMVMMSFFFTGVASYIVGLVGNSNSPVSGMTITAVLFTGLMLILFGFSGMQGMVATLGVAAVVCCAACTSGDVCNDLKTGQIVGATPWRQQIMQVVGVAAAAGIMAPVLQLLHTGTEGGIGGKALPAPQAQLFRSIAEGFFGDKPLPWGYVFIGAFVGVLILVLDYYLSKRERPIRLHLMPVAVGMYLPFGLAPPILLGGLLSAWLSKGLSEEEAGSSKGVLLASGIIAGESLMGVGLAAIVPLGLDFSRFAFSGGLQTAATWLAIAAFFGLFIWIGKQNKPVNH